MVILLISVSRKQKEHKAERDPRALLVATSASAAAVENSLEVPQKIKNRAAL